MLYFIVRPFVRIALKFFYKNIHISNIKNIPVGKPVILAANHPTAFLEPCILACFLDRPLHYLVRGDLFKKKLYADIMNSLHMLPVYRKQDRGFTFLKQNFSTFSACHQALAKNKAVMILAEGSTEHEKRLRPLVKGTSRIAFGTLEAFPDLEDVYVVPVGVNYTYADRPRSKVYIDFGKPISIRSYDKSYRENANNAMIDLTDDLREKLKPRVIIIENEADEKLTEQLFILERSTQKQKLLPVFSHSKKPLESEKKIADAINEMETSAKQSLSEKVDAYFAVLKKKNVRNCPIPSKKRSVLGQLLFLLIGLPIFLIGYIFAFPPTYFATNIVQNKIKSISFYSSVLMGLEVGFWMLYLILLVIFSLSFSFYLLLLPIFSGFSVFYGEIYAQWKCRQKVNGLTNEERLSLVKQRDDLLNSL